MQPGADGLQVHVPACHGTLHCIDKAWQQLAETHLSHNVTNHSFLCYAHTKTILDAGVHVQVLCLATRKAWHLC